MMTRGRIHRIGLVCIPMLLNGCTCTTIEGGEVGIVKVWGEIQPEPLAEGGPYFLNRFTTDVEPFSLRIQKMEVEASASSKDLQVVTTKLVLNFRMDKANIVRTYRDIGNLDAVESTIIEPAIQESIKKSTAQFTAAELVTQRAQAKQTITEDIKNTLSKSFVLVTEVSITDFQFDKQYQQAVEAKQIAEQKAQQAKNDLDRIRVEAEQEEARAAGAAKAMLVQAEAEARAQELIRKTITPEIVYLRAIEKWDGRQPQMVTSGGTLLDLAALRSAGILK